MKSEDSFWSALEIYKTVVKQVDLSHNKNDYYGFFGGRRDEEDGEDSFNTICKTRRLCCKSRS